LEASRFSKNKGFVEFSVVNPANRWAATTGIGNG
jgi:hypothetical protein